MQTPKADKNLFERAKPTQHGYRDVDPGEVRKGFEGVRLIDVREPAEFTGDLGHIQGAELVPLGTVAAQAAKWQRDQALLVICRSGGRSSRAASQLVSMGFTKVMNLVGGMMAYNR